MRKIGAVAADWTLAGFLAFWVTAIGVIGAVITFEPRPVKAADTQTAAPAQRVEVELGFAIASQADAALLQIRREATQLPMPALPSREATDF